MPKAAHASGLGLERLGRVRLDPARVEPLLSGWSVLRAMELDWSLAYGAIAPGAPGVPVGVELATLLRAGRPCRSRMGPHTPRFRPMEAAINVLNPAREYYFAEGCHILELSNSDGDPAVSIARARVAPGVTTRWHRLVDTAERYVLLSGRGRVEVGDLPAREVGPGDVVLIPPGCPQRIGCLGSEDLVFLAVCTPRFRMQAYEDMAGALP